MSRFIAQSEKEKRKKKGGRASVVSGWELEEKRVVSLSPIRISGNPSEGRKEKGKKATL